jgi:hypothetical protein
MGTWERQAALFDGSSAVGASKTAILDVTTRTATPPAQAIEQVLVQPLSVLSQQRSGLAWAACRPADAPSMDAMLEATAWEASMPQAIGAAEAVIGLAARARTARMAIRMRAMRSFSAHKARLSRGFPVGGAS